MNVLLLSLGSAALQSPYVNETYGNSLAAGEDIEPVSEESGGHGGEKDKNWGPTIGAAIIVNVVTLVGIIFLIPGISQLMKKANPTHVYAGFAAFAAGAIIASAFFLLLFEATHLISSGWEEESEQIWRWGVMILAGLLMPGVVETFVGSFVPDAPAATVFTPLKITRAKTSLLTVDPSPSWPYRL